MRKRTLSISPELVDPLVANYLVGPIVKHPMPSPCVLSLTIWDRKIHYDLSIRICNSSYFAP